MEKLSHYFANTLVQEEVLPINQEVAELFPTTAKAHNIMGNYKHVTRKQMQQRQETLNCYIVPRHEIDRIDLRWVPIENSSLVIRVRNDECTDSLGIQLDKRRYDMLPATDYTFTHSIIQRWLGMYDFKLEVIPTQEYQWLVPDRIVKSAMFHKHNFDKIAILEPKITEIQPSQKFMDDPVLVWLLNWFPDYLFFIDARDETIWIENISERIVLGKAQEKETNQSTFLWMSWL